jgi:hypothetical protein
MIEGMDLGIARRSRESFKRGQAMSADTPKTTVTATAKASTVVRAVATAAYVVAGSQSAAAQSELGVQLVDDLHVAFGKHRARAVHAKGVILEGSFTPARAAPALSKAAVLPVALLPSPPGSPKLGTITIDRLASDISMLAIRNQAYPVSFGERQ